MGVYFCECCVSSDGFLWGYLFSFDNFLFFSRIKHKYELLEDVLFLISLCKHCFKGKVAPDVIAFSVAIEQVSLGLTYITDPTDLFRTATFSPEEQFRIHWPNCCICFWKKSGCLTELESVGQFFRTESYLMFLIPQRPIPVREELVVLGEGGLKSV